MMVFDVSLGLSPRTPIWPGARPPEIDTRRRTLSGGHEVVDTRLVMIAHSGTHVDAPLHYNRDGASIDRVALDVLMGPCRVFEHRGPGHIGLPELKAMGYSPQRRALFKTANSARLRGGELGEDYISFLPEAIEAFVGTGMGLLGVDGFSIGPFGDLSDSNHVAFCATGAVIVEMLDLAGIEPGEYTIAALPLKLEGAEASPARVILIKDGALWH